MYPATGPGPAWGAPPVYLRPLGVGERIDAAFKLWSRNFLSMAKAMLVIAVMHGHRSPRVMAAILRGRE